MIKLTDVGFKYKGGTQVLKDINLSINEGEFVSIIGKNGAGKSTLAKLISGILKPTEGEILVDEINTTSKSKNKDLRKKVGIVFQNPENQIIFNNVHDDIAFALKNLNIDEQDIRITNALEKVKMSEYENKEAYELSMGQKQRITIAGVLAINPKYLVFDEPTTMIDSEGKEEIYDIVKNLKKQGYTIIYITNAIDEILMSDRIIILNENGIAEDFEKQDIIEHVDKLKKYGIKIPTLVKTVKDLKENSINIELKQWTMEEFTEKIIGVLKNETNN